MKTLMAIAVLSASAWAQMNITDLAPSGLLTPSGTIACANDSHTGTMTLTNTSGKEIIAIEADVVAVCPHTALKFRYHHDMFSKDHGMMPGDKYDVSLDSPIEGNPDGPAATQQFTISIKFLQFADGTTVGTDEEKLALADHRKKVIALYQKLLATDDKGLVGVLNDTMHTPPGTFGKGMARFLLDMLNQSDFSGLRAYMKNRLAQIANRKTAWGQ